MQKVEEILLPYIDAGEMERVLVRTPGFGGSAGMAIVGAVDWKLRKRSTFELMEEVSGKLSQIPDVRAFAFIQSIF